MFPSNQKFYDFVDSLSVRLGEFGFSEASRELNSLLHEMAWTTGSELFGEIKLALLKLKEGHQLPGSLSEDVDLCIKTVDDSWNYRKKSRDVYGKRYDRGE